MYVKIKDINGYHDQHQNVHSNLTTMIKHVDFTVNLFHDNFDCWYVFIQWYDVYKRYQINQCNVWLLYKKGNIVSMELITFHCFVKNIILDIYIWCNEAVVHTYVFRYVSNVFRINLES